MNILKLYLATAVVFFVVDFLWLTRIATAFYREHLGHLLRAQPVLWAAAGFYLLYIGAIVVFAVMPGLAAGSWVRALVLGAFLGLVAYATFDLTAMALFEGFPGIVVAVDLVWGTVLTASVSAGAYGVTRWLGI